MSFSFRSSRLAAAGLAAILAVGIIGVASVALAVEPADSPGAENGVRKHRAIKLGIHSLLKDSGVTREEVREGAAAGLTLGEIIDQYGDISAAEAKANALAALDAKLAELVANGQITQARADQFEAQAPALLDRLLEKVPGQHRGDGPRHGRALAVVQHSFETISEVTGIDVATLRERLTAGETVANIAGAQTEAVIDALVADANTAIENAVNGGKLPPEKADAAKEKTAAAIARFVSEGRPG
jgi:hypothetical protein